MLGSLVKMGSALLIVLGAMVLAAYGAKRFIAPRFGLARTAIKVLATSYLGPKNQISVIDVAGVYLVVGITPQQISFLTRLETFPPKEGESA